MNEALINTKQVLKFRQWSGKNYAVFASLGKEVNIGHVDIKICDKASEKSNQTKSGIIHTPECLTEEIVSEEESIEENLESRLITILSNTSNLDKSSQLCCSLFNKYFPYLFISSCLSGCCHVFNMLKITKNFR